MVRRQSTLSAQSMKDAKAKYGHFSTFIIHDDALYEEIARSAALLNRRGLALSSPTFLDLFEAELSLFTEYVIGQHSYQERSAKALLANALTLVDTATDTISSELLQGLRRQTDEQLQSCLLLRRFTKKNTETLTEVAQYADQQLRTICVILFLHQKRNFPSADSGLPVVFSDIYATLHAAETKQQVTDDKWVAPSSFERTTIKYWVEEDNLAEVLLLASANAPLLVYGRTGRLTTKADCLMRQSEGNNNLWDSLATPISSVYFDSPKLGLYGSRIVRDEGSQLLRVRWYGTKPQGKDPIFIELKTHHEKWINSKSVKERVTIQAQDMDAFLASMKWKNEDALALVVKANPSLSGDSLQKSTTLLLTMHEMVVKKGLRPCVRSVYKRAAFQSAQSNSLRLTVDRGVTLFNEASKNECDGGSWCLSDNDCATSGPHLVKQVPFAIFEVKLTSSEMPGVIQAMEDQGIIVKAAKFSKFLTGVAAFNADKVDKLPYWTDYPAFASFFNPPTKYLDLDQCSSTNSSYGSQMVTGSRSMKQRTKSATHQVRRTIDQVQGVPSSSKTRKTKQSPPRIVSKTPVRVEPKSYFANERTFIQWISGALLLVTVSAIILDFEVQNGAKLKAGFAMTLCGALIVCYATFVYFRRLKLLSSGSPYGYIDRVGPLLLACSVLVGVVVLSFYYFYRAGFGDSNIPAQVTLYAKLGECTQRSLQGVSLLEYQPSDVIVDIDRNLLLVPSLSQIAGLPMAGNDDNVEPLKVLAEVPGADLECLTYVGDRLFAVSEGPQSSRLIEFQWDFLLGQVQELVLQTPNVEGIAFIPDHSDGGTEGKLFVAGNTLPLDSAGFTSGIVDVYQVPSRTLQADNDGEVVTLSHNRLNNNLLNNGLTDSKIGALNYFEGVLYILHDNAQVVRAWDIEEGKMLSEWKLPSVNGGFNGQWEGIALERKGATGPQDALNSGGSGAGRGGLRALASSPNSLILHLTLDSPPQVWSLTVQEGVTKGEFVLPDCAG
jgi:SPX domain protein involved in polyphosphate accumulation/uncharacterized membrane protein YidH (DUF202 family)